MPRPVVQTLEEINNELITLTRISFLENTGIIWTHRDTDPIVLVLNTIARKIQSMQQENLAAYEGMLPGEASDEIDIWTGMFNIQRELGELSSALWTRQQLEVNNYTSATLPALRDLALSINGVQDVSFVRREDRDFDVYLASSLLPDMGDLPGAPTSALNELATTILNNIEVIHIDDEMHLQDPTVVGYLIELDVYYTSLNLPELQRQVEQILQAYVVRHRNFSLVPDASTLARVLDIDGIDHLEDYGFHLTPASSLVTRLPAVDNGFYSCTTAVLNDPVSLEANKIHVNWVQV